jgi:hypothetical protein
MAYDVRLIATADPGSLETSVAQPAQSSKFLAEALEQAERMVTQPGHAEAVVYTRSSGGDPETEIARCSATSGWSSAAITPASWWSRLSMPTREKLKADPYGDVPRETWHEIAEAGGAVVGIRRPGGEGAPSALRLPKDIADFIDSERPRL